MRPLEQGCAHGLVGQSPQIAAIRRLIEKASRNRLPRLLLGETGTGKEVVARAIHQTNPRGQFVPIDCGALVGTLMESELFGHPRGPSAARWRTRRGWSSWPTAARRFSTKLATCRLKCKRSCCG